MAQATLASSPPMAEEVKAGLIELLRAEVVQLRLLRQKAEAWDQEWLAADPDRRVEMLEDHAACLSEFLYREDIFAGLEARIRQAHQVWTENESRQAFQLAEGLESEMRALKQGIEKNIQRTREAWAHCDREIQRIHTVRHAVHNYRGVHAVEPYCVDRKT